MSCLAVVWGGALAGIALTLFWPEAPRWLSVALYLLLGWVGSVVHRRSFCTTRASPRRCCSRSAARSTVFGALVLRAALARPLAHDVRVSRAISHLHRRRSDLSFRRGLPGRVLTRRDVTTPGACREDGARQPQARPASSALPTRKGRDGRRTSIPPSGAIGFTATTLAPTAATAANSSRFLRTVIWERATNCTASPSVTVTGTHRHFQARRDAT